MRRDLLTRVSLIGLGLGLGLYALASMAQSPGPAKLTMTRPGQQPEGQVLNADKADPAVWPATFVFLTTQGSCTSTAVGERTIITAAHCVENNQSALLQTDAEATALTCEHHPSYPSDISSDFALCVTSTPIPVLGSGYEKINLTESIAPLNQTIVLLGYGCTTADPRVRDFGSLYSGQAVVVATPTTDLYLRVRGGAAVCYGDSGGGAYVLLDGSADGPRVLVAINSRGDISTNSWLSSTATNGFANWARTWSAQHGGAGMCGVAGNQSGCRN
jgi:hypothetical protein